MKISSFDREVRTLLESGYYKIPRFQRPYSWQKENVEEFWRDAVENLDTEYFIGSMVVFKEKDNYYGIVDGQQRLTTITIMLAVVRESFRANNLKDLSEGVQSRIERKNVDNVDEFVVQTETSYPYFHEYIQKGSPSREKIEIGAEETNLKNAYDSISKLLEEKLKRIEKLNKKTKKNEIEIELKNIRDKILKLKLIFIELDNEDDAYVIFETLNSRGKDLHASDLIKNHLIKNIKRKNKGLDLAKDKWMKLVNILDQSRIDIDINDFLLHYWLSKYEYVTLKELFRKFKKVVTESNSSTVLDALVSEAELYRLLDETDYKKWDKQEIDLKKSLDAIGIFRVKQPRPLLLSIMSAFRVSKTLKLKEANGLINIIESFHFQSTAITSSRSSGGVSKMYASMAREVREAKNPSDKTDLLKSLKARMKKTVPAYEEFELSFVEVKYSDNITKSKKLVQYILEKFDLDLRSGVPIDYSQMTIEHIMPQSTSDGVSTDQYKASIGNLIFVPSKLNEQLSNKSFSEKKKILIDSGHPIDEIIKNATKWGSEEISLRAKYLAKKAYRNIWSIK